MLKCGCDSDTSSRRRCGKSATYWLAGKGSSKKPICEEHAVRLKANGATVKKIGRSWTK